MVDPSDSNPSSREPLMHSENVGTHTADETRIIREAARQVASGKPLDEQELDNIVAKIPRLSANEVRSGQLTSANLATVAGIVQSTASGVKPINFSAATPAQIQAYLALQKLSGHGQHGSNGQRMGTGGASEGDSSARFDKMGSDGSGSYWSTRAGMEETRSLAIAMGLLWAADNQALLRLGPGAIQALADVHLRQESYEHLTKDVEFKAKDVVTLAKFAKEKKVDANELSSAFSDVGKGLSRGEKVDLRNNTVPYMAHPDDPTAQQKANEHFDNLQKKHPNEKPPHRKLA